MAFGAQEVTFSEGKSIRSRPSEHVSLSRVFGRSR